VTHVARIEKINAYKVLVWKPEVMKPLEYVGINENIILKSILKET
jgi:hypothetical protein